MFKQLSPKGIIESNPEPIPAAAIEPQVISLPVIETNTTFSKLSDVEKAGVIASDRASLSSKHPDCTMVHNGKKYFSYELFRIKQERQLAELNKSPQKIKLLMGIAIAISVLNLVILLIKR